MSLIALGLSEDEVVFAGGSEVVPESQMSIFDTFQRISRWLDLDAKLYICEGSHPNTCALPGCVVINKDEIEAICKAADGKSGMDVDRDSVSIYALAHEMGHLLQAQHWSGGWTTMLHDSFVCELQADFIAGVWIGANLNEGDFNPVEIANVAFGIGNPGWPSGDYPAPEQRQNAVLRGVAGAVWVDDLMARGQLEPAMRVRTRINVGDFERESRQIARNILNGQ